MSFDFEKLVDMASEAQSTGVQLPLRSTLDTMFSPNAYYTINGEGIWVAERDSSHGVNLTRLFFGDREYRDAMQWKADCDSGRIRQVGR